MKMRKTKTITAAVAKIAVTDGKNVEYQSCDGKWHKVGPYMTFTQEQPFVYRLVTEEANEEDFIRPASEPNKPGIRIVNSSEAENAFRWGQIVEYNTETNANNSTAWFPIPIVHKFDGNIHYRVLTYAPEPIVDPAPQLVSAAEAGDAYRAGENVEYQDDAGDWVPVHTGCLFKDKFEYRVWPTPRKDKVAPEDTAVPEDTTPQLVDSVKAAEAYHWGRKVEFFDEVVHNWYPVYEDHDFDPLTKYRVLHTAPKAEAKPMQQYLTIDEAKAAHFAGKNVIFCLGKSSWQPVVFDHQFDGAFTYKLEAQQPKTLIPRPLPEEPVAPTEQFLTRGQAMDAFDSGKAVEWYDGVSWYPVNQGNLDFRERSKYRLALEVPKLKPWTFTTAPLFAIFRYKGVEEVLYPAMLNSYGITMYKPDNYNLDYSWDELARDWEYTLLSANGQWLPCGDKI
jgi:hypothetical protein